MRHLCVVCTLCFSSRGVAPPWAAAPCLLSADWACMKSSASFCPSSTSSRPSQKVGWLIHRKPFLYLQALGTGVLNSLRNGQFSTRLWITGFVTTSRALIGCGISKPTVNASLGKLGEMIRCELLCLLCEICCGRDYSKLINNWLLLINLIDWIEIVGMDWTCFC